MELDISAPQILFVEGLCSRDACVLVVDFGRLRLANHADPVAAPAPPQVDGEWTALWSGRRVHRPLFVKGLARTTAKG